MKLRLAEIALAVAAVMTATPALASRYPAAAVAEIVDEAAVPAYPEAAKPGPIRHRHFRHRVERRHRLERPTAARKRAAERVPAEAPIRTVRAPSVDVEAAEAAQLGDLLGIPDGYADGIATSISESVRELAETVQTELDQSYLVATACPGYTMERQGVTVSIGRLNPIFVRRLAAANREARGAGIPVCVFSAYRPPAYGVGGFRDKFESAHAYGLAVDQAGLDGPGSRDAIAYRKIAARHGVYGPYSVYSRAEFNHFEPTMARFVTEVAPALRRTITAKGPVNLEAMWRAADRVIDKPNIQLAVAWRRRHYTAAAYHHHFSHHRYARL